MPLHLNAVLNGELGNEFLLYLVKQAVDRCTEVIVSQDKRYFHSRTAVVDSVTGETIGHFVCTLFTNREARRNEVLDLDFTLDNANPTGLIFLKKLPPSSAANEYYEVETAGAEQRLQIETVNRYAVAEELTDTARDVFVSVFPFRLSMYNSIDEMNRAFGFDKQREAGPSGLKVAGFADTFISPGGLFSGDDKGEIYSFLIGTVVSCRDVRVETELRNLEFVLAQVRTALGVVPVAMGREVFDIDGICPGKIVAMNADVKADLAKTEDFKHG